MYIIFALLIGVSVVMAMTLNKGIVEKIGMTNNIVITFSTATFILIILCYFTNSFEPLTTKIKDIPLIYFIGGFIGITTTYIFNILIFRISVVSIVLLKFIGQMCAGAALDYFFLNIFSIGKIAGAALFAAGLIINSNCKEKTVTTTSISK